MGKFFCLLFIVVAMWANLPRTIYAQLPTPEFDLCGKRTAGTASDPVEHAACTQCLYNPDGTVKTGFTWSVIGCLPTDAGGLTQVILQFSTSIIGGICFLFMVYGSFQILTSQGNSEKLHSGRVIVTSSIIAMLLVFFAVFVYRFAAENIIKIPGVG